MRASSSPRPAGLRGRGQEGAGVGMVVEGESLLISSPMMARGAQPYMAQELGGLLSMAVRRDGMAWRGMGVEAGWGLTRRIEQ